MIGGGAVGGLLASYLDAGGCLYGIYSRRGGLLEVRSLAGTRTLTVQGPPWPPARCTYALLAVKAYSTVDAIRLMKAYRVGAPILVVVQNGVGGLEAAESLYPGLVAGGVADFGAHRRASLVEQRGTGRLVLGCRSRDCRAELAPLKDCLSTGGLDAVVVGDIEPYRWLKLAVNAAINTITALLRVENGALLESPSLAELARLIARLVEAEASKRGIRLPLDAAQEALRVAAMTRENRSSTLQDIEAGRRSEADYILGPLAGPGSPLEPLYLALRGLEELLGGRPGASSGLPL